MDKENSEVIEILGVILEKMVTKDDLSAVDGKVDSLRATMKKGFASVHADIADLKSDVAELKTDNKSLHQEIRYIHQRLDELQKELKNHSGYAKEIDHLLGRVAVIEQHLGITREALA